MVFFTHTPSETESVGGTLARIIEKNGLSRAFIAMRGEMGVGKTAFVRGFAGNFGIRGVKSPTYTIVNEYRSASGVRIFHFDLYRIEDYDDLESIGFDDYLRAEGYSIAEWSVRTPEEIPDDAIRVAIKRAGSADEREICIEGILL